MQKQFLAVLVAVVLLVGFTVAVPSQFAIAQEEDTEIPTILEIVEIADDAATTAVIEIIKDDPELSEAVEDKAEEVEADPDVKPEIDEAIGNVTDAVSETSQPSEVLVNLNDTVSTTDVLMTLGGLNNTEVIANVIAGELAEDLIETDPELVEAINIVVCNAIDDALLNGTSIEEATATLPADIEAAVEANITPEEVADAEATETAEGIVTEITNGEADLETAVENTATDDLAGGSESEPQPEPEPTPGDETPVEEALREFEEAFQSFKEAILAAQ